MSIKARVGRHTQLGGRHCQNWADDQKTVIGLLNRISVANGGTGGSLNPRIIAGIASDELYNAIVKFENKQAPGQRSGFIDPGGKLMAALEKLASVPAAPAPAPSPTPAAPPPPPLPDERKLTGGEITLLSKVFAQTIPYTTQRVRVNSDNWGGETNSITPGSTPFLTSEIWCADFSDKDVSKEAQSTFVHEFTHVWQYYHGVTKLSALWLMARYGSDYDTKAYRYDLSDSDDLTDYNIEQQAAIIEDFWRLKNGLSPLNNIGKDRSMSSYNNFADQVQSAGLPHKPLIPTGQFRH